MTKRSQGLKELINMKKTKFSAPFPKEYSNKDEWNKKTTVKTLQNQPKKQIIYDVPKSSIKIILDVFDFIDLYKTELDRDKKSITNPDLFRQKKDALFIEKLEENLSKNDQIVFNEIGVEDHSSVNYYFEKILNDLLNKGKVVLLDGTNKIDHYIIEDSGFTKGPLYGEGKIEYKLPSGKTFWGYDWIS